MSPKPLIYTLATVIMVVVVVSLLYKPFLPKQEHTSEAHSTVADTREAPDINENPPENETKELAELVAEYGDLQLVDSHNHDASRFQYYHERSNWEKNGVDRIVLFGDVSEPSAIQTDNVAWGAYEESPERIIPFFSGVNLLDEAGLQTVKDNLEKGYFGIGEIAAASTYSPALANVAWKTKHPMDGILPEIYKLCAEYKAPVLLHIDPPSGEPINKLEQALEANPDTIFIFGHINAYNTPDNVENLLRKHPNLYADFFAGFTAFNPESTNQLDDFIPIIKQFPDRFVLSTDSGYGLTGGEEKAIEGMYRLIDALNDRHIARQVAGGNLERLIHMQPATKTQLLALRKAIDLRGIKVDLSGLTKEEAGMLLLEQETGH